jgi:hypothetical protein
MGADYIMISYTCIAWFSTLSILGLRIREQFVEEGPFSVAPPGHWALDI